MRFQYNKDKIPMRGLLNRLIFIKLNRDDSHINSSATKESTFRRLIRMNNKIVLMKPDKRCREFNYNKFLILLNHHLISITAVMKLEINQMYQPS